MHTTSAHVAADAFLSPAARRVGGVADVAPDGTLRMDYSVVPQVIFSDLQADTLIHEAIVAMALGATAAQFSRIPHYHPTLAEILTYPAAELAAAVRP